MFVSVYVARDVNNAVKLQGTASCCCDAIMEKPCYRGFWFLIKKKTTKAITMKLSIISFGPYPRIVTKFQTDRLRTFRENPGEKKIKETA